MATTSHGVVVSVRCEKDEKLHPYSSSIEELQQIKQPITLQLHERGAHRLKTRGWKGLM